MARPPLRKSADMGMLHLGQTQKMIGIPVPGCLSISETFSGLGSAVQWGHFVVNSDIARYCPCTKLSSTIFLPALSKSTVSLLPSTPATVPGPNF